MKLTEIDYYGVCFNASSQEDDIILYTMVNIIHRHTGGEPLMADEIQCGEWVDCLAMWNEVVKVLESKILDKLQKRVLESIKEVKTDQKNGHTRWGELE